MSTPHSPSSCAGLEAEAVEGVVVGGVDDLDDPQHGGERRHHDQRAAPARRVERRLELAARRRSSPARQGRRIRELTPSRVRRRRAWSDDGVDGDRCAARSRRTGRRRARWVVCTWPCASVARTRSVCVPDFCGVHGSTHCRQVSVEGTAASRAACHGPSSTCTSTLDTPTCWSQATPAIATVSPTVDRCARPRRVDARLRAQIGGAASAQPPCTQYACCAANVVASMSTTHLHADT